MINYTTANTVTDLEAILRLQKDNLRRGLTEEVIQSQGFVTVEHSLDQLKKLNDIEKHLIAKDGDKVIGYVLAMTEESKYEIPMLIPMFDFFSKLTYLDKLISDHHFIVVGQVCIDKEYRGQGIFDKCYQEYKKDYKGKYDFAITDIASSNTRSLKAHKRIGFKEIHTYQGHDNVEWVIVLWDWRREVS